MACSDDSGSESEETGSESSGDGDGDGDASASGDGDGDPATASGDGDGDDPSTSGDGDGDDPSTSGDGDGDDPTTSGDGDGDMGEVVGKDYAQLGPYGVDASESSMGTTPGCDLTYGVFTPDTLDSDIPVLLAHGFMRSIGDMEDTARHIASWGVTVYTVPLCTNTFAIDHEANGEAMAVLGEALAPEGALYSGFSAGGLAAFVAAAQASNAVAYVGLDSVDSGDIGLGLGGQLGIPARGSIAEPGQCNTNNNFLPIYDQIPGAPVIRIIGAQHFDYETDACGPGDLACSFCAPAGPEERSLALGMSTAAILLETGADLGGATWWQPGGEYFDELIATDKIQLIP